MAHTEQLAQLLNSLVEHFDLEELRTFCFDLGVDYYELRGEVKSAKARDLITVMLRQNRLADLAAKLHVLRPNVDWPDVEAISSEERLAWTTATEMQSAADYLAAVRDYCASLPYLSLHDIRPAKTLDEVYVPLKARPQPREKQTSEVSKTLEVLRHAEPFSIAEVMRQHNQPHVLILGEPGAGKSTLLRQMAERAWDAPDKIGLDAPCLPILIPLRRLAELDGSLEERLHRALTGELALTQDLPQGFFTHWREQTGANWLLLLDALDEVPAEQRPRLMDWLKRILKNVGPNRIVITTRPSGYSPGELDDKLFGHYDLLSFTPEQTGEFARKWFGDNGSAEDFLKELDRVRAGDLRGTPLLLTIAAKVYLEKGTLPQRRSALYDQFVNIWLAEAEQRGLRAELGDPVCDVARFALARLALAMTEQPWQSEGSLSQIAAAYLRNAVPLSADRAQVIGERFVRVMARRSGVFTHRGTEYDFLHPTFREYLAAWAVVQECRQDNKYDLEQVWQRVVSHWADENWREAALFALSILSDEGTEVTSLLHCIWPSNLRKRIAILTVLVRQGTGIIPLVNRAWPHSLRERILGGLMLLGDLWFFHSYRRISWIEDFTHSADIKGLYFAVEVVAEQVRVKESLRNSVIEGLLVLARDTEQDIEMSEQAAEALVELGRADEAIPILLAQACREGVFEWVRKRAAEALSKLSRANEAMQAWLALARDDKITGWVRERAVEALGEIGRTRALPDLERIAQDDKNASVRQAAQRAIEQIRQRASRPEGS